MNTVVFGVPLIPLIALVGGLIGLIRKDFLETIMALFLIAFGAIGLLDFFGIITVEQVRDAAERATGG